MKKYYPHILAVLTLGAFVYWKGCMAGRNASPSTQSGPAVLKSTDKEQILVDPTHHRITTVTHAGVSVTTLPDRPSTITEHTDGSVTVQAPQIGYQQRPFLGLGFSNKWRLVIGCDLLYWKKLDIGPAVSFESYNVFPSMRIAAIASYTVWSNTRLSIGVDHTGAVMGAITVRL